MTGPQPRNAAVKISGGAIALADQIAELKREQAIRGAPPFEFGAYASFVARNRVSLEDATRQWRRMQAAIETLEWLQRNEGKIRAKVGAEA